MDNKISSALSINSQRISTLQAQTANEKAMQIESDETLSQYFEVNPLVQAQRFRNLNELKTLLVRSSEEAEETEEAKLLKVEKPEETAESFERNNEELSAKILLILRNRLLEKKLSSEEILDTVLQTYSDRVLADEALDFLIQTASPETVEEFKKAKEILNDRFGLEIRAGRNMGAQSREFAKEGLGKPVGLRELYQDIINNPKEAVALFDFLADKFNYANLKKAIAFLFQSLGSDFRSRGPSIPHAELKRLIDETRSLQGILGVYRYFESRMPIIQKQFARFGLIVPLRVNFEILARIFIKMLAEKFMNPEKILVSAKVFGISEELMAQIIVYTQMYDALRQVAMRYFRNLKHRDEILKSFVDTLDKLEKELEEKKKKEKEK